MNKKTNRSSLRAPTVKPSATIAPSATLALDGEFPLSASNGVSAPEPSAAHDVLQAAMAPREGEAVDDVDGADAAVDPVDAPADSTGQDAQEPAVPAAAKTAGKKPGKKPARAGTDAEPAESKQPAAAKAIKPVKDKFIKYAFTLPESEMLVLDAMKKTHKANGVALKKSQLLRAGLLALADVDAERLAQLVAQLPAGPAAGRKKK